MFLTWKGDHRPRHVHVYRDNRLVVKWNLETWTPMKGRADARLRGLLRALAREGLL